MIDKQTGSQWNIEGKSIEGPLKGKQLLHLPFDEGFWFEWQLFILEWTAYQIIRFPFVNLFSLFHFEINGIGGGGLKINIDRLDPILK